MGVIKPIVEPTPAVSPVVVVRQNGKLRVCIDPSNPNKNLKRCHYPVNTIEELLPGYMDKNDFLLLTAKRAFGKYLLQKGPVGI